MQFFLKYPKIEHILFQCFYRFKIDHVFFLEMPHFFMFVFPEMPHFSHLILKLGHFRKNEHEKVGHFEKKHVINFKTEKAPKLNMSDFWAFQEKNAYAITWKISPPHPFWGISRNPRSYIQRSMHQSRSVLDPVGSFRCVKLCLPRHLSHSSSRRAESFVEES